MMYGAHLRCDGIAVPMYVMQVELVINPEILKSRHYINKVTQLVLMLDLQEISNPILFKARHFSYFNLGRLYILCHSHFSNYNFIAIPKLFA